MRTSISKACSLSILAAALFACGGETTTTGSASAEAKKSGAASAASAPKSAGPAATAPAKTAEPEKKDDSVTFVKHYPAVGDKATSVKAQTVELGGTVKGKGGEEKVDSVENENEEKVEECLVVTDKTCTKLKVTFTKHEEKKTLKGEDKSPKEDPLNGKTFIVELKGEEIAVTTEDGKEADRAAATALKKDYKSLALRAKVIDALPAEPVKVGDSLDALANALLDIVKTGEQKADKATATAKVKAIKEEGGKKIVTLEVTMSLEGSQDKMKMKLDVAGTIDVRADVGLPVGSDLSGPISVELGDAGKLEGKMKETVKTTLSF